MVIGGKTRYFYSRNLLSVMLDALQGASKVQLRSTQKRRLNGTRVRTGVLDSDLYIDAESEVLRIHGHKGRVMTVAVQMFCDAALVSWSKYHHVYPVRIRLANVAQIAQQTSALPFLPVLGAMHGLGTGQMALYHVFGFDLLH
eukprot:contig_2577_g495